MGSKIKPKTILEITLGVMITISCGTEREAITNPPNPSPSPTATQPSQNPITPVVIGKTTYECVIRNNGILEVRDTNADTPQEYIGFSTNFDQARIKGPEKVVRNPRDWYEYIGVGICSQNDIENNSGHLCHSFCDGYGRCFDSHHKVDKNSCLPKPSPKPSPTASPSPSPSPKPSPTPTPKPSPSPSPTPCPKKSWGKCK